MKILLFGRNGQLGWELHRSMLSLGTVSAFSKPKVDFEKPDTFVNLIRELKPDLILNPVAYTSVDLAETEKDRARQVNSIASGILAEEARRAGTVLIHYSTDYVFDGLKTTPYVEEDIPNPLNEYGRSKLLGEQAIQSVGGAYLILRTSWVYSLRQTGGFVNKILQWSHSQKELRVVTDQVGSPTWARMLADVTVLAASKGVNHLRERMGLYHLAGSGFASRHEWAQAILKMDPKQGEQTVSAILPAVTTDFLSPAIRPAYSPLNCSKFEKAFGLVLPDWQDALRLALGSDEG